MNPFLLKTLQDCPDFADKVARAKSDMGHHEKREHARLSASGSNIWINCAGSVRLSAEAINKTNEAARKGTTVHEIAERVLLMEVDHASQLLGTVINGFPVDQDMVDAVMTYVDYIEHRRGVLEASGFKVEVHIEERVHLDLLAVPDEDMFGSADCIIIASRNNEYFVEVIDYKNGVTLVEVEGDYGAAGHTNPQLLYYGLGAIFWLMQRIEAYELQNFLQNSFKKLRVTVIQPNAVHIDGPIRSALLEPAEVLDFAYRLRHAAGATQAVNPPLNAGSHCRWCKGKPLCPMHTKDAEDVLSRASVDGFHINQMDSIALGNLLDHAAELEAAIKTLREQASTRIEAGEEIPGWEMAPTRAMSKWTDTEALIERLEELGFSPSDYMKSDLKSVSVMKKLLGKDFSSVEEFSKKESSGKKLTQRARVFDNLDEQTFPTKETAYVRTN